MRDLLGGGRLARPPRPVAWVWLAGALAGGVLVAAGPAAARTPGGPLARLARTATADRPGARVLDLTGWRRDGEWSGVAVLAWRGAGGRAWSRVVALPAGLVGVAEPLGTAAFARALPPGELSRALETLALPGGRVTVRIVAGGRPHVTGGAPPGGP